MPIARASYLPALLVVLAIIPARGLAAQEDLPLVPLMVDAPRTATCPDEAVMTGLRARVGLVIDAMGIRCRAIRADGTLGSEFNDGAMLGGTGGTERQRSCPTGTVIVGQRFGSIVGGTPRIISRVSFYCRPWSPATRTTGGSTTLVDLVTSATTLGDEDTYGCSSNRRPVRRLRVVIKGNVDVIQAAGLTCLSP